MLTPEQEKWIAHLSDTDTVSIYPFDPTTELKFQLVKKRVQDELGIDVTVEHHGATSLGISGQDEIDVYVPVVASKFDLMINSLKQLFGEPRSHYPLQRARFVTEEAGKHVDVFLINSETGGWKKMLVFEGYLTSHFEALEEYRLLKESGNGLSVREYYRRKNEFINKILELADNSLD